MADAFMKWIVAFLCGGAVTLAGACITSLKGKHRRMSAIENGLQCLLRAEIIRSYEKYTERNHCPLYAKEALKREYDSYHNLGGNDVATDLYKHMMALPNEPLKTQTEVRT